MNGCPEDIIIIVKVWEIKRNYILQMGNILFCVCLIGGRHLGLIPTFGKRINWEICPRWLASFCSNGRFTGTTTTTNQLKINGLRNIEFVFSVWWWFAPSMWFVRLLPFDPSPLWRRVHFLPGGAPSGHGDGRICQHDAASQRRERGRIDVGAFVPYSGSSASLLRCLPSLNRRLATTTAVNNICSTRWFRQVRSTFLF